MTITLNDKELTPKNFVRYVTCSVLEDVEHNFEKYASVVYPEYAQMTELDKAKLNDWKHKFFVQMNKSLRKDDFNAAD